MRRRHKYQVVANILGVGFDKSVVVQLGETWANNENLAINNLKYRLIFNPEKMIFIGYAAKEVL